MTGQPANSMLVPDDQSNSESAVFSATEDRRFGEGFLYGPTASGLGGSSHRSAPDRFMGFTVRLAGRAGASPPVPATAQPLPQSKVRRS
jgi:hypothetical protein